MGGGGSYITLALDPHKGYLISLIRLAHFGGRSEGCSGRVFYYGPCHTPGGGGHLLSAQAGRCVPLMVKIATEFHLS